MRKKKEEKKNENDRFEFKIAAKEMQRFADKEMAKMKVGKTRSSDQAFMADIEVQSKSADKRCARCLIVALSRADKEHRSQVIALKKDISAFERQLAQETIKNQDLNTELEMCQNNVLEKNKMIIDSENLILDM
ncbi:hypothetical protein Hanom_Chr05g00450631 [Helianthus anomalus]